MILALSLLAACSGEPAGSSETPSDSGSVARGWVASLGEPMTLTEPGAGVLQTHATVAWGPEDRFAVAFAVGAEPAAQAVVQVFTAEGAPVSDAGRLNAAGATGDKPDVAWDGARWLAAWTDVQGRVSLAAVSSDGVPAPGAPLVDTEVRTDAVDLAIQPGGDGIAIWTEFGAPGTGPTDGRIVWRAFDPDLAPAGPPKLADDASRKTSDAAPTPDGGWIAVWAIEYDHPTSPGEVIYEVWGRLHRADGTAWTFRADDLDTAYPSRPAVAVRPDGAFAVSWRDKLEAEGAGLGSGAYVRLFGPDAVPLGPSVSFRGDGDRVVVDWAGDLAVVVWQETDEAGTPGVVLSGVDGATGAVAIDRLWLSPAGGERDERPSVSFRGGSDGGDAVVVWEAIGPGGAGLGLRARRLSLTAE